MKQALETCRILLLLLFIISQACCTPQASKNWRKLKPADGVKFTPRNGQNNLFKQFNYFNKIAIFLAHASCVFKGHIWMTGGRVDKYVMYNLLDSYKMADVWKSVNGGKVYAYFFD
jgi:hypothetical protein